MRSLVALIAIVALVGCGGGEDATTDESVAAKPDLERYCELVGELDARSAAIYSELEEAGVPTAEELAAAQLRILEENEALIAELEIVVPDEIREDFELSVESARQRAEAADASQPPQEVADAGIRLLQFRRDNCPARTLKAG